MESPELIYYQIGVVFVTIAVSIKCFRPLFVLVKEKIMVTDINPNELNSKSQKPQITSP
jgi:hypothetical protein